MQSVKESDRYFTVAKYHYKLIAKFYGEKELNECIKRQYVLYKTKHGMCFSFMLWTAKPKNCLAHILAYSYKDAFTSKTQINLYCNAHQCTS